MAVLGPRLCARAFSSCGKRGPLFIAVRGPLTVAASLVAEHRLETRRLSNCGSRAQLLRGTWDPPRPGLEPVSPALAGRFSTTAPPGKPKKVTFGTFILSLESQNLHASKVFSDNPHTSFYRWGNSHSEVEWLIYSYIALSSSPSSFTFSLTLTAHSIITLLLKKRRDRVNWARSHSQWMGVLLPPLVMLEYSLAQYFFPSLFLWWLQDDKIKPYSSEGR